MPVDVRKEVHFAVLLYDGGSVENPCGHGFFKANAQGLIAVHRRTDELIGPTRIAPKNPTGECGRIFDAYAAVAEVAAGLGKKFLFGRSVEIDIVGIRKLEFDQAQTVRGPRFLAQEPRAAC